MSKPESFVHSASDSLRMVSAKDLSAGYVSGEAVFSHLYLDLIEGQSAVILGPGNSGKSTLLKMIAGTDDIWQTGNLYVPWEKRSYSPQFINDAEEQNLSLGGLMKRLNPRIRNPIRQIKMHWSKSPLIIQKLSTIINTPLNQLSEHLQKLASLTLVLMRPENLVLLDEPEVGCSYEELQELIQRLNQFRQHRTVILITHHLLLAREVSDMTILMAYGRIIEAKPTPVFFTNPEHPYTQSVIRMGC